MSTWSRPDLEVQQGCVGLRSLRVFISWWAFHTLVKVKQHMEGPISHVGLCPVWFPNTSNWFVTDKSSLSWLYKYIIFHVAPQAAIQNLKSFTFCIKKCSLMLGLHTPKGSKLSRFHMSQHVSVSWTLPGISWEVQPCEQQASFAGPPWFLNDASVSHFEFSTTSVLILEPFPLIYANTETWHTLD